MEYQLLERARLSVSDDTVFNSIFNTLSMTFEKGTKFTIKKRTNGLIYLNTQVSPYTLVIDKMDFAKFFKVIQKKYCN